MASDFYVELAVWSRCNRFIAIGSSGVVDILDSATLQRIQRLDLPNKLSLEALAFSPDSRMLTAFVHDDNLGTGGTIVSWDLQTGGVVSTVECEGPHDSKVWGVHITYSMNGKMVAVLSQHYHSSTISIHDVIHGESMPSVVYGARMNPDLDLKTCFVYKIWTHGESLRFATPGPMRITIWEVGFTSGATPTEVEIVSVPDNAIHMFAFRPKIQYHITWTEFHPASSRLAFINDTEEEEALIVWDARTSRFLLHDTDIRFHSFMSFSPDARLFACITAHSEVYLWKESPTGYTLFEKLTPGIQAPRPSFSPNGKSIIAFDRYSIHLWHTKSFVTTTISAPPLPRTREAFFLEFLPDRPLAVFARGEDRRVTVLDLNSGTLQSTTETSVEVYGLRSIGNTIVVVGKEGVIAWSLPGGDFLPDPGMGVKDSTWEIGSRIVDYGRVIAASISFDFQNVALLRSHLSEYFLDVYSPSTGQNLHAAVEEGSAALWFTPGEQDLWCPKWNGEAQVFTLTQDSLDHTNSVADIEEESWGCPWGSQLGYKVTDDGWILGMGGKRLFILPPLWQSPRKVERVWNRKFVALLHGDLPEPVILELEP